MKVVAFIVAAGLVATVVTATPLGVGGSVSPINVFPTSLTAATPVSITNVSFFNSPMGLFSGELRSGVFTNCADNPYGLNALTFAYVVLNYGPGPNGPGSTNAIGRFTVNGYGAFLTDVGSEPVTAVPGYTDAFENNRAATDTLGWTFSNVTITGNPNYPGNPDYDLLVPGATSRIFVVHTNTTIYNLSSAAVIDGDIAPATAWAPLPTPGAGALLGLGAIAALRRRR